MNFPAVQNKKQEWILFIFFYTEGLLNHTVIQNSEKEH